MTALSDRLLNGLSDTSVDYRLARCYQWIWLVILHNQPSDALRQQLSEIETTASTATPQFQLELAWKAQVIEDLLQG